MTLSSIAGLLTLSDLGVSLSAKTMLAQAYGKDDTAGLRALAEECHSRLVRFGAVLAVVSVILAVTVDWRAVFRVTSPALAAQLPWALVGLAIAAGAAVPAALGPTLAAALRLTWVQHAAATAASALTLVAVAVASALDASWIAIVVFTLSLPALINGTMLHLLRRRLGWRGRAAHRATAGQSKELRHLGWWFMIPQAGSIFMVMAVPIVIAGVAGPVAVTAFNVLQRVFGLVNQAHWMALSALWPAYSEAHARADFAWMRQAYRRSWVATIAFFVPAIVILAAMMPQLVAFWVGKNAPPMTPWFLWLCAVWFAVQLLGQPPALVLNGLGRLRGVAVYGTAGHFFSLAGMYVGGRIAGPAGVIAGMAAGYVLIGLPAVIVDTHRALKNLPA